MTKINYKLSELSKVDFAKLYSKLDFAEAERRITEMTDLLAVPQILVRMKDDAANLDRRLHYIGGTVKGEDYSDTAKHYGLRELTPEERTAYVSEEHASTDTHGGLSTKVPPVEGHFRTT